MSGSNSDLDLSKVDSEDFTALADRINTFYKQDSSIKAQLGYHWERNQLMLDGKQWLVFDGDSQTGGLWRRLRVTKQNEYIPRPVTNYLFSSYQTLKGYLLKSKPRCTVYPNTDLHKDKNAARIATLCCEVNWSRLKEQYNYETAASNLVTYGTVFKKSYWDTTVGGMVKVPRMKTIPTTDPNTGAETGTQEVPDVDPVTSEPLFDELPLGDVNTYIIEPFRMCLDPIAMHLHDARWVMEYSVQPLPWVKEMYGKEGDGYTGLADTVEEEKQLNGSLKKWFALRTSAGTKNTQITSGMGASAPDQMIENACVVKEYYERPTQSFPKGRCVVVANDVTVFSGDSPYEGPEMGDWHPYSECRWELVPGRFWGKSPLDDAAEIQKQVNSIDSCIILTRKTMAIPQKSIPLGSGIQPGAWTGRPGAEVFYREQPSGAKPETILSAGVHESVFAERKQRVDDLKEITGAIDILKGDRPPGVNAASALSLLYEVGTGKLFPMLDRWKMLVESDQKKQLRLINKHYKEPRPAFIRMLMAMNSELAPQDISNFIGQDLYDNCNVKVEAGSNVPKLEAARQARLMELASQGMIKLESPENRIQFQQDMGITGYDADIGPDKKRAEWENDLLDNLNNSPDNKPVVLDVDNHDVHIQTHGNRQKEPSFMALPFEIQRAHMMHMMEHHQRQAMAMQAQMLQQQAMQPPGARPAPTAPHGGNPAAAHAPAGAGPAHGKGLPKSMKQAAFGADILTPASLGTER